jgi:hypothetical protein
VRPGLEVSCLLGRGIHVLKTIGCRTEVDTFKFCLRIRAMLKQVSHDTVLQSFRCDYEGRAASRRRYIDVGTMFLNEKLHDIQMPVSTCVVQGRAARVVYLVDISTEHFD